MASTDLQAATLCVLEHGVRHLLMGKCKDDPLIGSCFFCACPLQTSRPAGYTALLWLTGNISATLENVKLMQMEDGERHNTCDCMVSFWMTFPPYPCKTIWGPSSTVVILVINVEVKMSDILLNKLQEKFVGEAWECTENYCVALNNLQKDNKFTSCIWETSGVNVWGLKHFFKHLLKWHCIRHAERGLKTIYKHRKLPALSAVTKQSPWQIKMLKSLIYGWWFWQHVTQGGCVIGFVHWAKNSFNFY